MQQEDKRTFTTTSPDKPRESQRHKFAVHLWPGQNSRLHPKTTASHQEQILHLSQPPGLSASSKAIGNKPQPNTPRVAPTTTCQVLPTNRSRVTKRLISSFQPAQRSRATFVCTEGLASRFLRLRQLFRFDPFPLRRESNARRATAVVPLLPFLSLAHNSKRLNFLK